VAHTRSRSDVILRSVGSNGSGPRPSALAAATLRERNARANTLEFELAVRQGQFRPIEELEQ